MVIDANIEPNIESNQLIKFFSDFILHFFQIDVLISILFLKGVENLHYFMYYWESGSEYKVFAAPLASYTLDIDILCQLCLRMHP